MPVSTCHHHKITKHTLSVIFRGSPFFTQTNKQTNKKAKAKAKKKAKKKNTKVYTIEREGAMVKKAIANLD